MKTKASFKSVFIWLAAGVMIFYGTAKIATPGWLAGLGVMPFWNSGRDYLDAFLPWFEVSIGVMMLGVGRLARGARIACALLLLIFIPFLVYFLATGVTNCGCGGEAGGFTSHPAFGLFRNIVLSAGLFWAKDISTWPSSHFDNSAKRSNNSQR
jgi:hypothetical protein